MDYLHQLVNFLLNFDDHLQGFLEDYGAWTYAILFLIIFCETGLVVTPFLPGDSLLFAAGMFAGLYPDALNVYFLLILLSIAAIAGDTVNYWFGAWFGPKAFNGRYSYLKPEYLFRAQKFYEKYGGRAIVLGRFVPIVRTFVPFVAGIGAMNYRQFIAYNIGGGIAWVGICTFAGYWLGSIEIIRQNFEFVVIAIVAVSVLPMAWEFIANRRQAKANRSDG
jgi:membrane-associated protein